MFKETAHFAHQRDKSHFWVILQEEYTEMAQIQLTVMKIPVL